MSKVKSDIQIAREAKMQPINDILAKINVPDESSAFSPMGRHIAKINLEYLDTLKNKSEGKLILVTAITPTPAGVGVIAVTKINLPSGLSFKVSKYSKLIFAICLPIGLKAELSSGTFILANISFIGCILASLAIWISDLTSLI